MKKMGALGLVFKAQKEEEEDMYATKWSEKANFIKREINVGRTTKVLVSETMNIVNLDGEPYKDLYDNEEKLEDSDKRFLGWQVTAFFIQGSTYGWDNGLDSSTSGGAIKRGSFIPMGDLQPPIGTEGYAQEIRGDNKNVLVKYFYENDLHDLSQEENSEYVGVTFNTGYSSNQAFDKPYCLMQRMLPSKKIVSLDPTIIDNNEFDVEVGTIMMRAIIADKAFLAETGDKKRLIPTIGQPIIGWREGADGDVYIFTPTIYNADGTIAELEKD